MSRSDFVINYVQGFYTQKCVPIRGVPLLTGIAHCNLYGSELDILEHKLPGSPLGKKKRLSIQYIAALCTSQSTG